MKYEDIIELMKKNGVLFGKGLSLDEFIEIEGIYEFVFPEDLKEFLSLGLPISKGFYNWRNTSESNIKYINKCIMELLEGIIFDIEHNNFWYQGWGDKRSTLEECIEKCRFEYRRTPKMIPIYCHRFIPSEPSEINNPVFSIHQTDIIYYGENLEEYFKLEFGIKQHMDLNLDIIKEIKFWSDITG